MIEFVKPPKCMCGRVSSKRVMHACVRLQYRVLLKFIDWFSLLVKYVILCYVSVYTDKILENESND